MPRIKRSVAALLMAFAPAACAQGALTGPGITTVGQAPLTGPRADIARELPRYGYGDTDVSRLSSGQVMHIYHLLYSGRSQGDVRGQIGATLQGSFVQRGVDRVLGQDR